MCYCVLYRPERREKNGASWLIDVSLYCIALSGFVEKICVISQRTRDITPSVVSMMAHRLCRWLNIEPTSGECLVFAGRKRASWETNLYINDSKRLTSHSAQQTRYIQPLLVQPRVCMVECVYNQLHFCCLVMRIYNHCIISVSSCNRGCKTVSRPSQRRGYRTTIRACPPPSTRP